MYPDRTIAALSVPMDTSQRRQGCPFRNFLSNHTPCQFADARPLPTDPACPDPRPQQEKEGGMVWLERIPLIGNFTFDFYLPEEPPATAWSHRQQHAGGGGGVALVEREPMSLREADSLTKQLAGLMRAGLRAGLQEGSAASRAQLLRTVRRALRTKTVSTKLAGAWVGLLPPGGLRLEVAVAVSNRLSDSYRAGRFFRDQLPPRLGQGLQSRVGALNLVDPLCPWGEHRFDLSKHDERLLAGLFIEWAQEEEAAGATVFSQITLGAKKKEAMAELAGLQLGAVSFTATRRSFAPKPEPAEYEFFLAQWEALSPGGSMVRLAGEVDEDDAHTNWLHAQEALAAQKARQEAKEEARSKAEHARRALALAEEEAVAEEAASDAEEDAVIAKEELDILKETAISMLEGVEKEEALDHVEERRRYFENAKFKASELREEAVAASTKRKSFGDGDAAS